MTTGARFPGASRSQPAAKFEPTSESLNARSKIATRHNVPAHGRDPSGRFPNTIGNDASQFAAVPDNVDTDAATPSTSIVCVPDAERVITTCVNDVVADPAGVNGVVPAAFVEVRNRIENTSSGNDEYIP